MSSTLGGNVFGCVLGGRLKQVPYPTLPRNESTKKFDYPPNRPTKIHPLLAKVLLKTTCIFQPVRWEKIFFLSGKQNALSSSNAIKICRIKVLEQRLNKLYL
jgi:hypothetical protein